MKHNNLLFLCIFRRSVYWDNNLAKDWDNIEPTKSGNVYFSLKYLLYTTKEKRRLQFATQMERVVLIDLSSVDSLKKH